jgi:hypothetical protein
MKKKSDKGSGVSLSRDLREVISGLKDREPELDEILNREECRMPPRGPTSCIEGDHDNGRREKEED